MGPSSRRLSRFSPDVAEVAQRFLFHPSQSVHDNEDGSVTIAFRAGGFVELAWRLFTWGTEVTIIAPPIRLFQIWVAGMRRPRPPGLEP